MRQRGKTLAHALVDYTRAGIDGMPALTRRHEPPSLTRILIRVLFLCAVFRISVFEFASRPSRCFVRAAFRRNERGYNNGQVENF